MAAPREDNREANRETALRSAIAQIEKSYGKGTIMYLGDTGKPVDGVSTGAISLDLALGGGGIPRGRVIEVYGPESSGKTTLTLHIIAEAQRAGGASAFIDAEHAFNPSWAKRIGVNLEELLVNQPSSGEEALEICEMLVRSNALDVIVVDSVAALVPRQELEGQMGDSQVGLQARLMSQAMRKLTGVANKSRTSVIFINQIREKIGVMYGSPETTPGGRALKFYSSVRVDVRRIGQIKDSDMVVGNRIRVRVVKNKVAPPFRETELDILFDSGISRESDLIDLASSCGVVERAGTWYSYGETRLGQGRENARQFLKDNPDMAQEIREKVLDAKLPKPEQAKKPEDAKKADASSASTDSKGAAGASRSDNGMVKSGRKAAIPVTKRPASRAASRNK